jgi:hypothetical protein
MNDEGTHLMPVAAELLAETDRSMNSARIKENGASEKTPMQTFIDPLAFGTALQISCIRKPLPASAMRRTSATLYLRDSMPAGKLRPDRR